MKTAILIPLLLFMALSTSVSQNPTSDSAGNFTDSRDGHVYKWVKIWTQTWIAENLRFGWYFNGNGSDKHGFNALPAGFMKRVMSHSFRAAAHFWSSTILEEKRYVPKAWTRSLHYDYKQIGRYVYSQYSYLSVRCIKEE